MLTRTIIVLLSTFTLGVAGWGDVIHYPEFISRMEAIGTMKGNRPNSIPNEEKRSLSDSILELRRALDNAGLFLLQDTHQRKRSNLLSLLKRSFSTSQLRKQLVDLLGTNIKPSFAGGM